MQPVESSDPPELSSQLASHPLKRTPAPLRPGVVPVGLPFFGADQLILSHAGCPQATENGGQLGRISLVHFKLV